MKEFPRQHLLSTDTLSIPGKKKIDFVLVCHRAFCMIGAKPIWRTILLHPKPHIHVKIVCLETNLWGWGSIQFCYSNFVAIYARDQLLQCELQRLAALYWSVEVNWKSWKMLETIVRNLNCTMACQHENRDLTFFYSVWMQRSPFSIQ